MTNHAILAPSSAARRMACPGSRAMEAQFPSVSSPASLEGEAAHHVAAVFLRENKMLSVGAVCPNGEIVTEEMIEGADMYAQAIDELIEGQDIPFHIEEPITIENIHPLAAGTPDCWAFDGKELFIWDYKYGHSYVEVFENWQLIAYAAGISYLLIKQGILFDPVVFTFCIVQPRSYHKNGPVRKWSVTYGELISYFQKLRDSEYAALQSDAPCQPSPQCSYCTARHACAALQNSALTAVDVAGSNTPVNLPPQAVGIELAYLDRAAKLLEARRTGLQEQAVAMIKRGDSVPFYTIEQSKGRECWVKPVEEVIAMGKMLDVDLRKPDDVITPKQAIKKGVPAELMSVYSETPKGAMKLVPQDTIGIRKIFTNT